MSPMSAKHLAGALDNPLLMVMDEDRIPRDLFNRVTFKYDHGIYNGGLQGDQLRVAGEHAFFPTAWLAAGYEIPFFDDHRGPGQLSARGIGDMKFSLDAEVHKGERIGNAVKVEFTFPSASDGIGARQNAVKLAWGLSAGLAGGTVLTGILAYNKGMTAPPGLQGANTIEPELILAQAFGQRMGAFLDWDSYWDFNAAQFGQTLKFGLAFQLDKADRWSLSPYAQFPLNHFTSATNLKSDAGFDLSFRY